MGATTKQEFSAKLETSGPKDAWTFLNVPFDVQQAFGSKGRVSVKGTINGFAYRSSLFPNGDGTHALMVNKEMQKGAGPGPGDTVHVEMDADTEPREVEVPDDLAKVLVKNRAAKAAFEKLAPSHRKEYVRWIEDAKKPETRARRLQQAVEKLVEGKRLK